MLKYVDAMMLSKNGIWSRLNFRHQFSSDSETLESQVGFASNCCSVKVFFFWGLLFFCFLLIKILPSYCFFFSDLKVSLLPLGGSSFPKKIPVFSCRWCWTWGVAPASCPCLLPAPEPGGSSASTNQKSSTRPWTLSGQSERVRWLLGSRDTLGHMTLGYFCLPWS